MLEYSICPRCHLYSGIGVSVMTLYVSSEKVLSQGSHYTLGQSQISPLPGNTVTEPMVNSWSTAESKYLSDICIVIAC